MLLVLQRAERVGDAFDGIRQRMRVVVHRVDAPRIAGPVMTGVPDAVEHRVAHVDVRRRHVDLRAQHVGAVGELARAHAPEQVEVLVDRASAERRVGARFGQRAAMGADLVGRVRVDVGEAAPDQVLGVLVEPLVVVRGVELAVVPVEAEPADVLLDGVHVLDVFLDRVGVVEAQVAAPAVLGGDAEVEADGLGVADVQVAVRFGREAGDHLAGVDAAGHVGGDDLADEVERRRGSFGRPGGAAIGTGHDAYQFTRRGRAADPEPRRYCAQGGPDSVASMMSGLRPRRVKP